MVTFSFHLAENMLNIPLGRFQNAMSSDYRIITFNIIFQGYFCFLVTSVHKLIYVQSVLKPSKPVSQYILNYAFCYQTVSMCSNLEQRCKAN